jgi:tRNA threonylcarbamoyladenosine biosynthesis protein TsaE
MSKYVTHSLEETSKAVNELMRDILLHSAKKGATVVGLYGELGAGKTTFVQSAAKFLGVAENIVSPTFVIEKIYDVGVQGRPFFHMIHIDAYRMEKSEELIHLNWQEIIEEPTNIIFIEWPERVADIMPEHIRVNLSHISENERAIELVV